MMKLKINKLIFAVVIVILAFMLRFALGEYQYRYSPALKSSTTIFVPSDAGLQNIVDSLSAELKNTKKFIRFAKKHELEQRIKSGKYNFNAAASYAEIIRHIQLGLQQSVKITFNNIRTLDRLASVVSKSLEMDSVVLATYLLSDSTAQRYGFDKEDFISMFIPNTYQVYWSITPEGFIARMSDEYDRFWNESRVKKAEKLKLTPTEVSALASIVYEETKMTDEMAKVAGVYLNRLRIGMPLQADPTVKFAHGDFSIRRILYKHIKLDSPYNTYKYKGLPPGAICMPSIAAIDAVLENQQHKYLYFCASADFSGYHSFARTLVEHNKNARAYSKALDKRGIYK